MANWIVEALAKEHERDSFCCGQATLDDFLKRFAKQYAKRKLGTTYLATLKGQKRVLGYFTLAPSHFEFAHAPAALLKGLPKHPVPTLLLARLAADQSEQGKGLGKFLLLSAFERCLHVARAVAFRAIEVEALDDATAGFYRKYGFLPFPTNPHHLAIALESVEGLFARRPSE
jgi:GNAT superfamily N-acetyltransferase